MTLPDYFLFVFICLALPPDVYPLSDSLDPINTGLVTKVQVLYLLEICCLGCVFIILYDKVYVK